MNKKLLLVALTPLLLASCGESIQRLSVEEVNAILSTYSDPGYTKFSCEGYVEVLSTPKEENEVYASNETLASMVMATYLPVEKQVPLSWVNGAPLHITSTNYYFEGEGNVESADCAHYYLEECLVSIDSTGKDYFQDVDIRENSLGGLTFKVTNEFLKLTLYSAYNGGDLEYSGRVNTEFVYDENGYLVKEETISTNYKADKVMSDPTMLHSIAEYTYA